MRGGNESATGEVPYQASNAVRSTCCFEACQLASKLGELLARKMPVSGSTTSAAPRTCPGRLAPHNFQPFHGFPLIRFQRRTTHAATAPPAEMDHMSTPLAEGCHSLAACI